MTLVENKTNLNKTARLAGILYLLVGVFGVFGSAKNILLKERAA